jgi:type IV secretory pathway VirB2 component (pilin)
MKKLYEIAGGRKLFFAIILMIIASVMTWFSKLESIQWIDFMKWIFGIYAGGNVTEHIAKAIKKD